MLHLDHAFGFMPLEAIYCMWLCVLFCGLVMNFHEFDNNFSLFSEILTVSPSNFAGLFSRHSLLIPIFASLAVVNMQREMKDFVAMN